MIFPKVMQNHMALGKMRRRQDYVATFDFVPMVGGPEKADQGCLFNLVKWCKGRFPCFAKHMRANTVPKPKLAWAQTQAKPKAVTASDWSRRSRQHSPQSDGQVLFQPKYEDEIHKLLLLIDQFGQYHWVGGLACSVRSDTRILKEIGPRLKDHKPGEAILLDGRERTPDT